MKLFLWIGIMIFFLFSLAYAQSIELEPITVEKAFSENLSQSADSICADSIKALPVYSLEELIDYFSGVQLRKRASFGVQQDISLRGSVFEDNIVTLGGVKINDSQTGHFSLEIPLTSADLEKINILNNSQTIDFVTKKPQREGVLLKTSFGQHALFENLLSLNFPLKDIKNRVSIEHKVSSGGRQDTDFDIYNFSCNSLFEDENKELEFLFGSTQRDFGADAFYVPTRPHEEEHITQRFFSLRSALLEENFKVGNAIYFRRHSDKYILNRHNPSAYTNYHTTYIYGLENRFDFENDLFFSSHVDKEKVTSTNLQSHRRLKEGVLAGIKEKKIGDFILDIEAGLDYYESWQYLESGRFGLGYFIKDDLKAIFSFDRFWRAPSFTELYYNDTFNIGNDSLSVQKANSFEWGLDYLPQADLNLSSNFFLRNQRSTIDWVKDNPADAYQARNIGKLKTYGIDFYGERIFSSGVLDKISIGYTYLNLNKADSYAVSKYVFDYSRHKVVSMAGFKFSGISLNLISNFQRPLERKEYVTFDVKMERKVSDFLLSMEGINMFNQDYWEAKDIEGSSRWYKISVSYSF